MLKKTSKIKLKTLYSMDQILKRDCLRDYSPLLAMIIWYTTVLPTDDRITSF